MTIVVTGGSGFIGRALIDDLLERGHTLVVVDRAAPKRTHPKLFFIQCDVATSALPYNILEHTDAVINLVGEPIAGKWSSEKKTLILESRTHSTRHIVESIAGTKSRPTTFICASATGFYGDTGDESMDERGEAGKDFLAGVTLAWEAEAREAIAYGVRVVCVRTAPVLGTSGGILSMLMKSARFGFLLNSTKENPWFSWIYIRDIVSVYRFALETTTLQGVVNAASPEPVHMQDFMQTLSRHTHRRIIGTVPHMFLNMRYGEMADEFSKNSRIVPKRLLDKGFEFNFGTLDEAFRDILKK